MTVSDIPPRDVLMEHDLRQAQDWFSRANDAWEVRDVQAARKAQEKGQSILLGLRMQCRQTTLPVAV